jgi:hypothetical protein
MHGVYVDIASLQAMYQWYCPTTYPHSRQTDQPRQKAVVTERSNETKKQQAGSLKSADHRK